VDRAPASAGPRRLAPLRARPALGVSVGEQQSHYCDTEQNKTDRAHGSSPSPSFRAANAKGEPASPPSKPMTRPMIKKLICTYGLAANQGPTRYERVRNLALILQWYSPSHGSRGSYVSSIFAAFRHVSEHVEFEVQKILCWC
jgi:hypothetical protein